jgi:uncharacterized repeat protein (TIGR03803 family)
MFEPSVLEERLRSTCVQRGHARAGRIRSIATTGLLAAAAMIGQAQAAVALKTLHAFAGADGAVPMAGLVQGKNGLFYGVTNAGGDHDMGTVFSVSRHGEYTLLYSFGGADGESPEDAPLVLGTDGNFYGTTSAGGTFGHGTVFRISPQGALNSLYSFRGRDGDQPFAGLVQGTDGAFYGTTFFGGDTDNGTVFRITKRGALTTLHSFNGIDGSAPASALVQGSDGNFYGTTPFGGSCGTAYRITPHGEVTVLHDFDCRDGGEPDGIILGADGALYGMASLGGQFDKGAVFKVAMDGTFNVLYSFTGQDDGLQPISTLMLATDGNFYGTTWGKAGTLFRMTPDGALTTLYHFRRSHGAPPEGVLIQDAAGNLYGAAGHGGDFGEGAVFSISGAIGGADTAGAGDFGAAR